MLLSYFNKNIAKMVILLVALLRTLPLSAATFRW